MAYNGNPIKVQNISELWINSQVDLIDYSIISSTRIDSIKPIRLTEEILLKCGFEKYDEIFYHHKRFIIKNGDFIVLADNFSAYGTKFSIKYLHQLQNLYFVLVGKEYKLSESDKESLRQIENNLLQLELYNIESSIDLQDYIPSDNLFKIEPISEDAAIDMIIDLYLMRNKK